MPLEVIPLHGPPRLGGILFPFATMNEWMRMEWEDESDYLEMDDGTVILIEERHRGRCVFGYDRMLDLATFEALIAVLKQKQGFSFSPRTIKAGVDSPTADEPVYTVRCTSPLPTTRQLIDEHFEFLEIELVTVGVVTG